MKTFLTILITVICLDSSAQISKKDQAKIDSLYLIAHNKSLPANDRATAYNTCCWTSVYQDYGLGLKLSTESAQFAKQSNLPNQEVKALHFLGFAQMMLGQIESAEKTYQRGLTIALSNDNFIGVAEAYANIGNLKYRSNDATAALEFHKKSLYLAEKHDFGINATRAHINIGEIYEDQGNFDQSLKSFQKAKNLAQKHGYDGFYSSIFENLGDINLDIDEQQIAAKYYRLALLHAIEQLNENRQIRSLRKLGTLHQTLGQLDSASFYFNRALEHCIRREVPILLAATRSDVANLLFIQGDLKKAAIEIQQSLSDYEKFNEQEGLREAFLIAGKIHLNLGELSKSEKYFKRSYNLALKSKELKVLKEASFGLYKVYKMTGDSKQALFYHEEFDNYKGQLRGQNEIKQVLKMEIAADFKRRAFADSLEQLHAFEKLDFEHQKSESRSRFILLLSIGGIILLSLALSFSAYTLIQRRKSTQILSEKNKTIRQALKDKEILLKEVHHRVKNNMQVVSSLLALKSKNMPDEIAKEALLDSKLRIDSMQLAHQRMYQNGNYEEIDVISYAKDIFRVLLNPIQQGSDLFIVKGEELLLHVEQAQTLGYIIHEFVMNSIKHAWPDSKSKYVEISLERHGDTIRIVYIDNGQGLPNEIDPETSKTFGMNVINSLVKRQLKGSIKMTSMNGLIITLLFDARPIGLD